MGTRRYTTVHSFFLQDDSESIVDAVPPRFGLKDDSDDRWEKFKDEVGRLNASAPAGTQYKVVFVGRHGEGYHNVAMEKYTVEEWTRWARETGDGELVWGPDPALTQVGIEQARNVNRVWREELPYNIPLPERLYTSPMRRAIKTNQVTFEGLLDPDQKTTIVENIREKLGVSTADKRRIKSEIASEFSDYPFEQEFAEEDELWHPDIRETAEELDIRARKVLDMIFDKDEEQFISITSHHGFISGFQRVCQHRVWLLPTGGVVPIVLKAEQLLLN